MHRARAGRPAVVGAALLAVVIALALAAPAIAGDPVRPDLVGGLDAAGSPLPPGPGRWLGTDALGRDAWARLVHGAARTLAVAGLATALATIAGTAIGTAAGYRGGATDAAAMRGTDVALAVPALLVAVFAAAALRAAGLAGDGALVLTLAALGWPGIARVVRAKVRVVRASDYVLAARALGASEVRVLVRHVGPAIAGLCAGLAALALAQNLVLEAALGYLGLGAPPPAPTWGRMLAEGQPYLGSAPWLVLAPGLAIVVTVTACNLLGQGLRRAS